MERKCKLIYHDLEKEAGQMKKDARVDVWEGISLNGRRYFEGFGDKIIDLKALDFGNDSTVYLVKIKGFENRTQLVKVYDGLKRELKDINKTTKYLKYYNEALGSVRKELNRNNNPLEHKCKINGEEFGFEYKVAQSGILIERNGEVGSWIRNWVPGKNFNDGFREHEEKWEIIDQIQELCEYLTSMYGFEIKPTRMNYKVNIDIKSKTIKVVFTDLANSVSEFMENIGDINNV
jgi:hypothetical protein